MRITFKPDQEKGFEFYLEISGDSLVAVLIIAAITSLFTWASFSKYMEHRFPIPSPSPTIQVEQEGGHSAGGK